MPIFDVFQKGLIRGAEHLSYDPTKAYAYVEHPTEGWRVYLRGAAFLHEDPLQLDRFMVFRNSKNRRSHKNIWEPPKGQMEGKDFIDDSQTIYEMLSENIRREVAEEAKIYNLRELQHTGLILQSREPNYSENTFFQYHIFTAYAHMVQIDKAFEKFKLFKDCPEAFAKQRREQKEKDDIAWYDATSTNIMGKWSPTIVDLYLKSIT